MANDMERVEKFEKQIEKVESFIQGATSYIYDAISDPDTQELVECTRAVVISNQKYLSKKEESLARLKQTMSKSAPITATIVKPTLHYSKEKIPYPKQSNIQELIELVTYSYLETDTMRILESQTHRDILRIKMHFLKQIIKIKQIIRDTCISNPQADISNLQSNLDTYTLILDTISELEREENLEEVEEKEYSNIIFAPNNSCSTYLYEDISEFPDKSKEIKLIMDKLVDGYFLKTKDTKSIEGYQENLYEYKHPNGIRILYVVEGNIIIICSLFMKDKQKSSRISNEYEEAINRYYRVKDYILENYNNPDFHIEQGELIGKIYQFFEGQDLSKKVGEE